MEHRSGLNETGTFDERVGLAMRGAERLDIGVAYAKTSGVSRLLRHDPPRGRAVVGLGFGITDPEAVEQLDRTGFDVRVVADGTTVSSSQFHPKLYVVHRPGELLTLSGSANLTGSAWTTNVEQFEELRFHSPSEEAGMQEERFERVWDHGQPLALLRREGRWDEYRERARDRRILEREDRRRLAAMDARTGRLVGGLARAGVRDAPGYIGITNDEWWEMQLRRRDRTDTALFWRRNTNRFRALADGGMFFHLVKAPGRPEDQRAVRGYSVFRGDYEVGAARILFGRYGPMLGVETLPQLHDRLKVPVGGDISVVHLTEITELPRAVTLAELRSAGVAFARNIVSGRGLALEEIATILELGGLGAAPQELAAEHHEDYNT